MAWIRPAPLHVLRVTDRVDKTIHGFVAVGKVVDASLLAPDAVQRNGWAMVGDPRLSKLAAPWALATLTGPVPPDFIGTFYPEAALDLYAAELALMKTAIAAQTTGSSAQIAATWVDGFEGFLRDTLAVTLRFDLDADHLGIDLSFAPRAKNRLATFVAAQKPMDLALLNKLAAAPSPVVMAGKLSLGPYRAGMIEMLALFYGQGGSVDIAAAFATLMAKTTGEFAGTMAVSPQAGLQMRALYALADPAGVEGAVGKMFGLMATPKTVTMSGTTTTTVAVPGTTVYDGVAVHTYDSTTTPATIGTGKLRGDVGVVDALIATSTDGDIKRTIDAARGKGPGFVPTAAQQAGFARARKRQDSFAITMDLGAVAAFSKTPSAAKFPVGFDALLSMGFADRTAHMYFALPTASLKAMVAGAASHP